MCIRDRARHIESRFKFRPQIVKQKQVAFLKSVDNLCFIFRFVEVSCQRFLKMGAKKAVNLFKIYCLSADVMGGGDVYKRQETYPQIKGLTY